MRSWSTSVQGAGHIDREKEYKKKKKKSRSICELALKKGLPSKRRMKLSEQKRLMARQVGNAEDFELVVNFQGARLALVESIRLLCKPERCLGLLVAKDSTPFAGTYCHCPLNFRPSLLSSSTVYLASTVVPVANNHLITSAWTPILMNEVRWSLISTTLPHHHLY